MKAFFISLHCIFFFSFGEMAAQSRSCDESVRLGDTLVCRDVNSKGRPNKERFYLNGNRVFTRWWRHKKNGEFEYLQKNGKSPFAKANGPAYMYYPNGAVKATTFFQHGKKIGPCKKYYPSGALEQTCERHIEGKQDGLQVKWHENGQLKSKARWENGRLREILAYKDEQGKDMLIGTFKDGNGDWLWHEKGKPAVVYTYKNGKFMKKKTLK